jgi:crotonobetaine/carnitine-CoA ligase
VSGRTSVLDRAFHPSTCWDRVRAVGATQFFGVGAMIMMLWALPRRPDDATLPFHLMISAPVPAELHRPLEERYGCRVVVGYGLSEAMLIASHRADEPVVPGTVGRPSDLYEVRLVDDEDGDVPVGTPGEIVVRPRFPHVMFESYLGRPAETLAQFRNLWFHTGDLGRFDDDGHLSFVDRKKDAIRRRGENISSFEVEREVNTFPAVLESAAVAVPSPHTEDDLKVAVVAKSGMTIDPEELREYLRGRVPKFMVPDIVEVLPELPKTPTGKIQKHLLR